MLALPPKNSNSELYRNSELGCCQILPKYFQGGKSINLGRMLYIDLTNKLSIVGGMNYGYEGQRSRSK